MEYLIDILKNTKEVREWGLNWITIGALGTLLFTFLQTWGIWKQNKNIKSKKSGEGISVTLFGFSAFYFMAFINYGFYCNSIAMILNGCLGFPCFELLKNLEKFKTITTKEKMSLVFFSLMPLSMALVPYRKTLQLVFLIGILWGIFLQILELVQKGKSNLEPKTIRIFLITGLFWFVFALAIKDVPLMIFNPIAIILYCIILFLLRRKI